MHQWRRLVWDAQEQVVTIIPFHSLSYLNQIYQSEACAPAIREYIHTIFPP